METRREAVPTERYATETVAQAAEILRNGGLVAFPTETVYGLAVNLSDAQAVKRLYSVKKRPVEKPLPVIVCNKEQILMYTGPLSAGEERVVDRFLPGPLTILLDVCYGSFSGKKLAFRMPDNPVALDLIQLAEVPLGGTSANLSGDPSPLCADDVEKSLSGKIDMILDNGAVSLGKDSTIIDCTHGRPSVVREGPLSESMIVAVWQGEKE